MQEKKSGLTENYRLRHGLRKTLQANYGGDRREYIEAYVKACKYNVDLQKDDDMRYTRDYK